MPKRKASFLDTLVPFLTRLFGYVAGIGVAGLTAGVVNLVTGKNATALKGLCLFAAAVVYAVLTALLRHHHQHRRRMADSPAEDTPGDGEGEASGGVLGVWLFVSPDTLSQPERTRLTQAVLSDQRVRYDRAVRPDAVIAFVDPSEAGAGEVSAIRRHTGGLSLPEGDDALRALLSAGEVSLPNREPIRYLALPRVPDEI